jgi:hypothetical protein
MEHQRVLGQRRIGEMSAGDSGEEREQQTVSFGDAHDTEKVMPGPADR